jgi:hypothetical protein
LKQDILFYHAVSSTLAKKLTQILSTHFSNGFRINSPIEIVRFRRFAVKDNAKIHLSDDELINAIIACGIYFEDKVYTVTQQAKNRIKELANDYFKNGAQIIFYSEFFAKNENWLFKANIISKKMLMVIFNKLFPKMKFTQAYFGITNMSIFNSLESEILRVWGTDVLLTYEQLAGRLQYIPLKRIKYALGQNNDFIWNSTDSFSHISKIIFTKEEHKNIHKVAQKECTTRGYISITDLPLGDIQGRNHELSVTAIHNATFRICLSDKFEKKGKIVFNKGDTLNVLLIMKEYCRTINKCSLDDLLNYEKELTGEIHRWIPMEAGNNYLVRINKDTYISDRFVHFNSNRIDNAIGQLIKENYLPLKAFTTFGTFPDCGQIWNLFLLESYCRRFSKNYRFDTLSVNSRNAGTIIRKSCTMTYTEIMADAVAKSGIELTEIKVGRFLFDKGYTGRNATAKNNEIIYKVKTRRD